jgi:hypothetical protein
MMRIPAALACLALACSVAAADENKEAPEEASSTAEIVAVVDSLNGEVRVNTVEVSRYNVRAFVIWYCPYFGKSFCKVHAYAFDEEKGRWIKFLDREFATEISVEVGHILIIRDDLGTVFRKAWW